MNTKSKSLVKAVREISGYNLSCSNGIDGTGYQNRVIEEPEIPSLSIEISCEESALVEWEINSIFVQNFRVLPTIAR